VINPIFGRATLSGHGSQRALCSLIAISAIGICFTVGAMDASTIAPDRAAEASVTVPAWVFPVNPPSPNDPPAFDRVKPLQLPHSTVTFTEAQLNDLFAAPDWHPMSHSAMPEVVARGRAPDVYACGFCHTPGGQGRPENASLAGLPAPYIVQQLADFKSGARRSAWRGPYRPPDLMIHTATYATVDEVAAAAAYFSQQTPECHVHVVERARVPRSYVVGWVYAAIPGAGNEPLGQRLLEFAPDITRHELRDDDMRYIAYAPLGSISRGRSVATTGADGLTIACISCHGDKLQGIGLVPPLAGRSPTYLLRQLLAFSTGARAGATALPMLPVVAKLEISNMIDVAAYAASLQPEHSSARNNANK
jgi:cytochrome c553